MFKSKIPCRISLRATNPRGHCVIKIDGKTKYVHRVEFENQVRKLQDTEVVHHLCRNKRCYEITHLEARFRDEHSKFHSTGEENFNHVLYEQDVRDIRSEYYLVGDISYSKMAEKYNVTKSCIMAILTGRSWSHV